MKANELRIRNWLGYREVDLNVGIEIIKHYPATLNDIHEIQRGNVCNRFTYILITEEWLLKFGFEKAGRWFEIQNYPIKLYVNPTMIVFIGDDLQLDYIKYVHQLQNLYFALTGEELEIKE